MSAMLADELDLLQLLGHDESDVLGVQSVPTADGCPELFLVYKRAGSGKANVISYEVRRSPGGFRTDYRFHSAAQCDFRRKN
jgi:hypothetical protein